MDDDHRLPYAGGRVELGRVLHGERNACGLLPGRLRQARTGIRDVCFQPERHPRVPDGERRRRVRATESSGRRDRQAAHDTVLGEQVLLLQRPRRQPRELLLTGGSVNLRGHQLVPSMFPALLTGWTCLTNPERASGSGWRPRRSEYTRLLSYPSMLKFTLIGDTLTRQSGKSRRWQSPPRLGPIGCLSRPEPPKAWRRRWLPS